MITTSFTSYVTNFLVPSLRKFDLLDMRDPVVLTGLVSDTMMKLDDISQQFPSFFGEIDVEHADEMSLVVSWRAFDFYDKGEVTFKFNPFRYESSDKQDDLIAAYNRAMSIL